MLEQVDKWTGVGMEKVLKINAGIACSYGRFAALPMTRLFILHIFIYLNILLSS
jgi:hypothetical protein